MSVEDSLARNIVASTYEDLTAEAIEVTKKQVLDCWGIGLAGSGTTGINDLVAIARDWAGKPESTVLAYGERFPATDAAQINASMMHALDFDDTHDPSGLHPACVAVATAMAMAQRQGDVSGKEFITAVALGVDLACRMSGATRLRLKIHAAGGWHPTATYGVFSAAAIAGRLLELDQEKMLHALGIAYSQAAGNVQGITDGGLTKRLQPGFAARGGITAALIAQRGITGTRSFIDGEAGIYKLYHDGYDPDKLTSQLGTVFEGVDVSFKPYPCCRVGHRYIDAALEMVKQHDIRPEDVEDITITAGNMSWTALCQPLEFKRQPRHTVDAQFSLPWALACAVARRRAGLKEFTEEAIKDPALLEISRKVKPVYDSSIDERMNTPMNIVIRTAKGAFAGRTGVIYGSPEKPMTLEAIAAKFRDCAPLSIKPLSQESVDRVIDTVAELETLDDVNSVFKLLD